MRPTVCKFEKIGDCKHVFDYHKAYDLGYRTDVYPKSIANCRNYYLGNGLCKIKENWVEVPIGSYVVHDVNNVIAIITEHKNENPSN